MTQVHSQPVFEYLMAVTTPDMLKTSFVELLKSFKVLIVNLVVVHRFEGFCDLPTGLPLLETMPDLLQRYCEPRA